MQPSELQKKSYHFHSLSRIMLIIGIVAFANVLLSSVSWRLDLTANRQFTLSQPTKNIIQKLKNPATIKVFFSKQVPQHLLSIKQDTEDLMAEYGRIGKNNIIIQYIDPKGDESLAAEAAKLGIPEIRFNTYEQEKIEVTTGYAGIALLYGEKIESIPVIQDTNSLEYDITVAIQKMARDSTPIIGITTEHGESLPTEVQQALGKQYEIKSINIKSGDLIPENVLTFLIAGPTQAFTEREKFVLDQFIMRGGRLIILASGTAMNEQYLQTSVNDTGLNTILGEYGVIINSDTVIDPLSNEILAFGSGFFQVVQPYPAWPKIIAEGLNQDNPITARLQYLTMPWPSSLKVSQEKNTKDTKIIELAKTSPKSFSVPAGATPLIPEALAQFKPSGQGSKTIAVMIQGRIASAFTGKNIPPKNTEQPTSDATKKTKIAVETKIDENILTSVDNGGLVVIADSKFLTPDIINRAPENFILLANTVDALSQDQSLVEIRSRSIINRPIKPLKDKEKIMIKYGNISASAVLSVIVGLAFFFRRRKKDRLAISRYA